MTTDPHAAVHEPDLSPQAVHRAVDLIVEQIAPENVQVVLPDVEEDSSTKDIDPRTPVFLSGHDGTGEVSAVRAAVAEHGHVIGWADPSDSRQAKELRAGWLARWQGPVLMTSDAIHRLPRSERVLRHVWVVVNGRVTAPLRKDARKRGVVQFVMLPMPGSHERLVEILAGIPATFPDPV